MTKAIQIQRYKAIISMKKTKDGRVQKKNDETYGGISIEKKSYTFSELSGLQGKFKKIDKKLSVDEEKSGGKSNMVNMKTSIFEVMKQNLMELLKKHPIVKTANQIRTAKAVTEKGTEADTEYHIEIEFHVDGNEHQLMLKIYSTNCRIQVQHSGKSSITSNSI
jgi:hypothetical protein